MSHAHTPAATSAPIPMPTTAYIGDHVLPVRTNVAVFLALLALLGLTILASVPDLGPFALAVALVIATVKAVLILMYFMHVKYSPRLIWVYSSAAFFWLMLLLLFTLGDYYSRDWILVLGK